MTSQEEAVMIEEEYTAASIYAWDNVPSVAQERMRKQVRRAFLKGIEWQKERNQSVDVWEDHQRKLGYNSEA